MIQALYWVHTLEFFLDQPQKEHPFFASVGSLSQRAFDNGLVMRYSAVQLLYLQEAASIAASAAACVLSRSVVQL